MLGCVTAYLVLVARCVTVSKLTGWSSRNVEHPPCLFFFVSLSSCFFFSLIVLFSFSQLNNGQCDATQLNACVCATGFTGVNCGCNIASWYVLSASMACFLRLSFVQFLCLCQLQVLPKEKNAMLLELERVAMSVCRAEVA